MYDDENTIYLIHIKEGFDAKIRDLSNQILISANRLWNDINSGKTSYIESVFDSYNKKEGMQINKSYMLENFKSKKEIIFVMAYRSSRSDLSIKERIKTSKSNIAKYSLIQCSQEMSSYYPLRIFDIIEI